MAQGSFNSQTYNFNNLLGRTSFPALTVKEVIVPPYQRSYSWEKNHVATFWDDVLSFHKDPGTDTYFLGPIVILPGDENVTLLDGQQRLATATILLSVIRDLARKAGGQSGGDLARDIQRDLVLVDEDKGSYALTLNELDKQFFIDAIQKDPPEPQKKLTLRSHVLIQRARTFLANEVESLVKGKKPTELVKILRELRTTVADKIKTVGITVSSEDEAFLIFETLNDRGLRLSVPDLLLNHLMRTAKNAGEREQVRSFWDDVLQNVGTRQVSTFLRHMWVSKYGDVKAQSLYREIKERLIKDGITSLNFAQLCATESDRYVAILDQDKTVLKNSEASVRAIVKSLSAEIALPALLSGLTTLDEQDFEKLAKLIVAIVVRHYYMADLNQAALEEKLYDVARGLRSDHEAGITSAKALQNARNALKAINPTKKQLEEGLAKLVLKKSEALYIVKEIARHYQSSGKALTFDRISIEHIFPESADKKQWPKKEALEPYIWHVGNLTILEPKFNKDLGNKMFSDKAKVYPKSEIKMSQSVAKDFKTWDEASVIKRAQGFGAAAEQIWQIT
jgi:hypothetical protein